MSSSIEKGHGWLLVAVCTSLFFMPFMMAGVNAVLPPLGQSLHASARELGLMGAFYSMGLAVFQLASGSMGDIWGYRRIFLWGIALFALAGALLGFVNSVPLFLLLRFVQGVGGAMFNACGLALLASAAPEGRRASYLGYSGSSVYAGIACGPPVAGFVAGWLGGQWLSWGSALASVGVLLLMKYRVKLEWRMAKGKPFDWKGCCIYAGAMTALTFGSSELADAPALAGGLLVAFVGLMAAFCIKELRSDYPLLDLRLLARNRVFALSSLAAFINYSSFFGIVFFFRLYLQFGRGMTVQQAMRFGVARGLFSNEAGLGSTPHAHALAKVKRPQDQGAVAILGVFIDTFVVLTLTGLVLITSGLVPQGLTGTALTQAAFSQAFGGFGPVFIAVCMFFFAFSTIIGWYFFGQSNFKALFGEKLLPMYSVIVVAFILVGSTLKVDLVWALADLFNGLMAIPNLLALLALSGVVAAIDRK